MDEQNVVHPYNGTLLGNKNEVLIHATTWMNPENITLKSEVQKWKEVLKARGYVSLFTC